MLFFSPISLLQCLEQQSNPDQNKMDILTTHDRQFPLPAKQSSLSNLANL